MALKKPKKPRFKAFPKMPKASASTEVWKRFESRLKAVKAENDKIKADYSKRLKVYESEMKLRERIKSEARAAKVKW